MSFDIDSPADSIAPRVQEHVSTDEKAKENHDFYELAWWKRKQLMEGMIENGERNPLRILRKIENLERTHELECFVEHFQSTGDPVVKMKPLPINPVKNFTNITISSKKDGSITLHPYKYLPSGAKVGVKSVFHEDYHIAPAYTHYNIVDFIVDFTSDRKFDAIIELGSGFSQNLFKLYYGGGPRIPYYGGEYTNSGTACAKMLAILEPDLALDNFKFDFNRPDYSSIPKYDSVLVFTSHAIEQVEYLSDSFFSETSRIANNVTCIHFEPFGFQIASNKNEVDETHRRLFNERGWNKNLFTAMIAAHQRKDIEINFIGKNIMGSYDDGCNPTSFALWNASHS